MKRHSQQQNQINIDLKGSIGNKCTLPHHKTTMKPHQRLRKVEESPLFRSVSKGGRGVQRQLSPRLSILTVVTVLIAQCQCFISYILKTDSELPSKSFSIPFYFAIRGTA